MTGNLTTTCSYGAPSSPERKDLAQILQLHSATTGSDAQSMAFGNGQIGSALGDFRIEREIGRGGMGIVYEGVQISLGRRVAIKVLPYAAAVDDKQIARFKNEAQAAAQVDHPNIVPVFAIGQEHGVYYFAMQLIAGQSLSEMLTVKRAENETQVEHGSFSTVQSSETRDHVSRVARMGIQVAEALHAAHEIGVVHRDVKPSNLLLDDKGKVWVTDFGVARCKSTASITETGHALGTVRYMSPEQAKGNAALVDHRTDVYSLGVTLYELATLVHPFEDVPVAAMPYDFGRANLRGLRHWNHAIPADFENIVLKAMADARDERYSTAGELADDLRRFVAGEPILARRPSLTARLGKWARRHRRSVGAAVAVLALAVAGIFASLVVIAGERASKDAARRQAEENFRQAQAKFRQAQNMLDQFGSRVAQQLADVPGAEGIRKELLAEMLPYYREFARESAGDVAMKSDLALTFTKIGYLSDQLGSQPDAERAYRDAQSLLEQLLENDSANEESWRSLALCSNNLGQLLQKRGDMPGARRELQRALAIQYRLVREFDSIDYRSDLATTQSNIGLWHSQVGDLDRAADSYRAAIFIQESIRQSAPHDARNLSNLAASYNNLASAFQGSQPEEAKRWIEQAMSFQWILAREYPKERSYQSDLALSYNNLGALHSAESRWSEAEDCFLDAIDIQRRLVATSPLVATYRRDLSVSYNNLGMAQSNAGAASEAEASFLAALDIQNELVAAAPQDVTLISGLGGVYNNLGMVHLARHDLNQASEAFQRAIAQQQKAHARAPHVAMIRESLSKHYFNYARVLRRLDRPVEAADVALQRRQLWQGDADRLLLVAEELAAACKNMVADEIRQRYIDETKATLEQAMSAGLKTAPDLTVSPFDVLSDAGSERSMKTNGDSSQVSGSLSGTALAAGVGKTDG